MENTEKKLRDGVDAEKIKYELYKLLEENRYSVRDILAKAISKEINKEKEDENSSASTE